MCIFPYGPRNYLACACVCRWCYSWRGRRMRMFLRVLAANAGIHVLQKQFWLLWAVISLTCMGTAIAITKTRLIRTQAVFLPQQRGRITAGTWGTCPTLFVKLLSKSYMVAVLLQKLFLYWAGLYSLLLCHNFIVTIWCMGYAGFLGSTVRSEDDCLRGCCTM